MCTPDGIHLCTWNLDVNRSFGQSMQYRKRVAVKAVDSQLYSKGRFFFIDWHPPSLPRQFVQLVTSLGSGRMAPLEPARRNRHKRICRCAKASQASFCNNWPLEVRIDETNRMSLSFVYRLLFTPDILTHLHKRTRLFHPFFCITQPFSSSQRLCYLTVWPIALWTSHSFWIKLFTLLWIEGILCTIHNALFQVSILLHSYTSSNPPPSRTCISRVLHPWNFFCILHPSSISASKVQSLCYLRLLPYFFQNSYTIGTLPMKAFSWLCSQAAPGAGHNALLLSVTGGSWR